MKNRFLKFVLLYVFIGMTFSVFLGPNTWIRIDKVLDGNYPFTLSDYGFNKSSLHAYDLCLKGKYGKDTAHLELSINNDLLTDKYFRANKIGNHMSIYDSFLRISGAKVKQVENCGKSEFKPTLIEVEKNDYFLKEVIQKEGYRSSTNFYLVTFPNSDERNIALQFDNGDLNEFYSLTIPSKRSDAEFVDYLLIPVAFFWDAVTFPAQMIRWYRYSDSH